MKYFFILGRNPELSLTEIISYFNRFDNPIKDYLKNKNSVLIDVEKNIPEDIIEKLGGTIAIGEVIASGSIENIFNNIENEYLYSGTKNKFNYIIWDFADSENVSKLSVHLKKIFKLERLKSTEKQFSGNLKLQTGEIIPMPSSNLIEEEYFLFYSQIDKKNYFGKIIKKCDYKKIEERDMNKPIRREELSISPRLAKIMINLSQVLENGKILDSFCGIGTILQEALIQNITVVGIDNDEDAIEGAKKNLKWFKFIQENYNLILGDSKRINLNYDINVLVSEPSLGDILKKYPSKNESQEIFRKFENLMINVLNNFKKKIKGRIVFTAPFILVNRRKEERVSCNINNILNKTKLKLLEGFPIAEFRDGQIVGREIFVLE